jgi:hypothetical protein
MNMWMSFTLWQRIYPKLIVGLALWLIMGDFAEQAGAPNPYYLWFWIIAIPLAFLCFADVFAQARFRIWHGRVNRYRDAVRRGDYDNDWQL